MRVAMLALLIKIIPLALASTLSPGLLGVTVILLGRKDRPKEKTIAFLVGSATVAVILTFLGYFLSSRTVQGDNFEYAWVIDLLLGLFFVGFGLRTFFQARKKVERKVRQVKSKNVFVGLFLLSFVMSGLNFDAVLLYLTQVHLIGEAEVDWVGKMAANLISVFFFLLPITLPLGLYMIAPRTARKVIDPIQRVIKKYGDYIIAVLFTLFGIYFLWTAIGEL